MIDAKLSDLLDDADFWEIQQRVTRFNLFEAMGAVSGELRHSNFLGYLLSPSRPHGLGNQALQAFIRTALEGMAPEVRPLSSLELLLGDLDGAVVHRERDNIDILIEVSELELVVVVENKIRAKAGVGQLEGYRSLVEARYPRYRKLFVFLTPDGHAPNDKAFQAMTYAELADSLSDILDTAPPPAATKLILEHYVDMLRKNIVQDQKLNSLAAKLYERHAEALDFIFANKPRGASLLGAIIDQVSNCDGLVVDSTGANIFRFSVDEWDERLFYKAPAEKWSRTGRGILFEVKTFPQKPGRLNLSVIVGPGDQAYRSALYEAAKNQPNLFVGLVKPMGQQFATIFSRDFLTAEAAANLTVEAQTANARMAWSEFQGDTLTKLISAIMELDAEVARQLAE